MRIIIAEYPKSGGTWLVSLLGDCLDLPKRDIYVSDGYQLFDIHKHPWYKGYESLELTEACVIKSHELPDSPLHDFPAHYIHLVRDGRDVVVSKYFFERDFCIKNHILQSFDFSFNDYLVKTALEWRTFVLAWLEQNVVVCRYEDLLKAPQETLEQVLLALGKQVKTSKVQHAIEANRKEKMHQVLNEVFVHNTFVRKAMAGDWRNYFSTEQLEIFYALAGDALNQLEYKEETNIGEILIYSTASSHHQKDFGMKTNPATTFFFGESHWLNPVQIGAATLLKLSVQISILEEVLKILEKLEPDDFIRFTHAYYKTGIQRFGEAWNYTDLLTVLCATAKALQPENYLEIGVFRGRSMAVVANMAPGSNLYGFDLWIENYADLQNPGPEFVRSQIKRTGHRGEIALISGNSHHTVPDFLEKYPDLFFDLINVDGDHTEEGARIDLQNVLPRLKIGGVLVFDDINHPQHPWLERVWDEVVGTNPNFLSTKYVEIGHGIALAIRRSVDTEADRSGNNYVERLQKLRTLLSEADAERNSLRLELAKLRQQYEFAEADRIARLEVIYDRSQQLDEVRVQLIETQAQLKQTQDQLEFAEADRAARLKIIQEQGSRLGIIEAERNQAVHTLKTVLNTRTYKTLHHLGRWHWLEQTLAQVSETPPISGKPDFYQALREPKHPGGISYNPEIIRNVINSLKSLGYEVQDYHIDVADYRAYFEQAAYKEKYPNYYDFNLPEKSLEHYIAAKLLELGPEDVYIDIASEGSPVPEIYQRLYGCTTYRQDLSYPPGLNNRMIGGNAADMPVPNGFASKMALHCSFEHFENESDINFIKEVGRVLKPGGSVCIVPFYLHDKYAILTDPNVAVPQKVQFEEDAILYCDPTWKNRHGRFYDPVHLYERIHKQLNGMKMTIYKIMNAREVNSSCYVEFAGLISKS